MQARPISQFGKCRFNRGQIASPNEQVEIRELPQRHIAIKHLGQYRPFVRQNLQTASRKMTMNVEQFESQPKSSVSVSFILLAEGLQPCRFRDIHRSGQSPVQKRDQAVMFRLLNQPLPVEAML